MNDALEHFFARNGQPTGPGAHGPDCPPDEAFAAWLDPLLPAAQRETLELHALACAGCHDLLRLLVDVGASHRRLALTEVPAVRAAPAREPVSLRILGRLVQRGLQLLNPAELSFRTPGLATVDLRGPRAEVQATEWLAVRGPGGGLDELEFHVQANGTAQLVVHCEQMPALGAGELASILLELDGSAREKRPFSGEPIRFAPIGRGSYRVRLIARAPGGPVRPLAEAMLELTA